MIQRKKISLDLDAETLRQILEIQHKPPYPDRSLVIRYLIKRGLEADAEQRQQQHLSDFGQLKILHMLRELTRTRSDEFLQEVDEKFLEELPLIRQMIMDEGMDYAGR